MRGFQTYGGHFSGKKRRLRQRTHKLRASRNMGGHFSGKKKGACGNVPTSLGLPNIWGAIFWEKNAPAATYPQVQGFQKSGGHFSGKKSACGNVVSRSGLPKNPKIENSQNQNPFCPKCRQYFFKPEKEPPGPIWGHPGPFFAWAGKIKKITNFCLFSLVGRRRRRRTNSQIPT